MKDPIAIDFSELDRAYTKGEVRAYKPPRNSTNQTLIIVVISIIVGLFFLPFTAGVVFTIVGATGSPYGFASIIPIGGLVALGVWGSLTWIAKSKEFSLRLSNLATANKLQYIATFGTTTPGIFLPRTGAVFGFGSSEGYTHVLGNEHFAIANYHYTTGSGKNRQTHYWLIGAIKLSKPLPHTLFDSTTNNFLGMSNLPAQFKSNQLITSEAEFDNNFKLYAPEGYTIDVLSYIAPDFIAVMLDYFKGLDVEMVDDCAFIYQSGTLNAIKLKQMIARMSVLQNELEDNIKTYQRTTVDASAGSIAANGARLKRSFALWPALIVVPFMVLSFTNSIGPSSFIYMFILIGFISIGRSLFKK